MIMGNETDDASRRTAAGLTPAQVRVVATLGFCGLVSAADNWFVSPALPAIAQTLSVAPVAATVILTAYMLPYGTLQPVCGSIADRIGRLRLLRIIVAGLCAGTFLCAVVPSLPLLVVARIVTGCFAAGIIAVSQAFVSDVVAPEQRGGAVGILMGITFAGQGLSAGLGGILTDVVGWRAAFATFGVLAALAWVGLLGLREPSHRAAADDGSTRADAASSVSHSEPARPAAAPDASRADNPIAVFLRSAVRIFLGTRRTVYLLACSTGLLFLGVYGLMGTFLNQVCGLSSTQAGLVMMFYGVCCLLGGSVSGKLGARRGIVGVIRIGELSGVLAVCALMVSTATGSWVPALVAAACLGFGYISVQPSLVTLSMDADPLQVGLCTGLIGFGVFAGGGVGSALGGAVLTAGGYLALWVVAAAGLLLQFFASTRLKG